MKDFNLGDKVRLLTADRDNIAIVTAHWMVGNTYNVRLVKTGAEIKYWPAKFLEKIETTSWDQETI